MEFLEKMLDLSKSNVIRNVQKRYVPVDLTNAPYWNSIPDFLKDKVSCYQDRKTDKTYIAIGRTFIKAFLDDYLSKQNQRLKKSVYMYFFYGLKASIDLDAGMKFKSRFYPNEKAVTTLKAEGLTDDDLNKLKQSGDKVAAEFQVCLDQAMALKNNPPPKPDIPKGYTEQSFSKLQSEWLQ